MKGAYLFYVHEQDVKDDRNTRYDARMFVRWT